MKQHNMKLLTGSILAAFGITLAGLALADVATRSTEDMNADLMRTYKSHGGPSAGAVGTRSEEGNYSELMRDWDGKLANNARNDRRGREHGSPDCQGRNENAERR